MNPYAGRQKGGRPAGLARLLILAGLALALGCSQPALKIEPTPAPIEGADHTALRDASRYFTQGAYLEALNAYHGFLRTSVGPSEWDTALFQIGRIFRLTGRDQESLAVFWRLTNEFPDSPLVPDAMLEILSLLADAGRWRKVIYHGTAYLAAAGAHVDRTPYFTLVADAFDATGAALDAAWYHYQAWRSTRAADTGAAWERFRAAAEQLAPDDLQKLVSQIADRHVRGLLLYRLGMAYIVDERYDDAFDVLSLFVAQFSDHPDFPDASNMLRSLTERSRFKPGTVGCVLPLSGPYQLFGRRALEGIELAFSHIAAQAGTRPLQLVIADSRSEPESSANAVARLDEDGVGAILGPIATSAAAAASAQSRGIPILVFTQRQGIPDLGAYVFRNFITPQMQARALVSYAMGTLKVRRFAILYPDEGYGRNFMNLFWDQVIEQNGIVTAVANYDPDGTDFGDPIRKLAGIYYTLPDDLAAASSPGVGAPRPFAAESADRSVSAWSADPLVRVTGVPFDRETADAIAQRNREERWHPIVNFDAVFIPDAPKKAGLVIPQLAYYDIRDVHLIGTNLWNATTLLAMSGDYMQRTLISDAFFADSEDEHVKRFVAAFAQVYGSVPGVVEATAYDSARMLFETLLRADTDSRRVLKEALMRIDDFEGVTGRTAFAPNGEARKELQMLRIKGGRFVQAHATP